jgi:hypothetical protein
MSAPFDSRAAREALCALEATAAWETLCPPDVRRVFVPTMHPKALEIDRSVVIGMRGSGKSFWTAVLASDDHRGFVARSIESPELEALDVRVGFGVDDSEAEFPNAATIARMIKGHRDPLRIWGTVILRHALKIVDRPSSLPGSWEDAVGWACDRPREADELLTTCDDALGAQGRTLLVVFDAFDRLGSDWASVVKLARGALETALACRSRKALRAKLFIRPDLDDAEEVWAFPDSSKLRQGKVELTWRSADLYSLVFAYLINSAVHGDVLRRAVEASRGSSCTLHDRVYQLPRGATTDEGWLQEFLEQIADPFMGKDKKRGTTYTWIPTHLADAAGRVSPRSLLLAFKRAAEFTSETEPDHPRALHYSGIQDGVARASETRVDEIAEDYPWVKPLLEAARGLLVPCDTAELVAKWPPDCLSRTKAAGKRKLPPRRFTTDPVRRGRPDALIEDLVDLAVVLRTRDGRLNIPDIFRVGFGIKRKGGVKPPR